MKNVASSHERICEQCVRPSQENPEFVEGEAIADGGVAAIDRGDTVPEGEDCVAGDGAVAGAERAGRELTGLKGA